MFQVGGSSGPWYWQSSPANADWIPLGPSTTISLHLAAWTDAQPEPAFTEIEIAPAEGPRNPDPALNNPDATVSYFTNASGSLGQFAMTAPGLVEVQNAECTAWWTRIVVAFDSPDGGGPLKHGPCWK
jgi:hypothetical protein